MGTDLVILGGPTLVLSHLIWGIAIAPPFDGWLPSSVDDKIDGSDHLWLRQDGRHDTPSLPVVHRRDARLVFPILGNRHIVHAEIAMV